MVLPSKNINLNLYRVFYIVAKTKSFSESSRVLHISQPAISKHIQNLEYELNTLLFYRTNRGIELTPEAIRLLSYVEKAYNYLIIGERELQEDKDETKGKITIGIESYLSGYYLKEKIMTYLNIHPNITIKQNNNNHKILNELLMEHNLDLLITSGEIKYSKDYKIIELFEVEYCFACLDENSSKNIKTLEEVLSNRLILTTPQTKIRTTLDNFLNTKNLSVNSKMEFDSTEMLLTYIKEGLGICFIPKKIADSENLYIIKIEETLPKDKVYLIYNEESQTNSSKELIELLKSTEL